MFKVIRLLLAAAAAVLLVAWFFTLRPEAMGGPASYVMVRGQSMEPTLHGGDLAVVRRQEAYHNGDVVAFRVPEGEPGEGAIVMHRIVDQTEEGFVTQGDNRDTPDGWRPTSVDIVGRMWFSVPGGGQFVLRLQEPIILGLVAGGLGMLTVLLAPAPAWQPRLPIRGRRTEAEAKDGDRA